MIGTKVRRKSDRAEFIISGQAGGGWVLQRTDEFASPIEVGPGELRSEFNVKQAAAPAQLDEQSGWERLSERFWRSVEATQRPLPAAPTPEDVFTGRADDRAAEIARDIAADDDRLADYEVGLLPVHASVDRELRKLLRGRQDD